jgi:hypothetical protein
MTKPIVIAFAPSVNGSVATEGQTKFRPTKNSDDVKALKIEFYFCSKRKV